MSNTKRLFILILLYCVTYSATAKQLHFSKVEKGDFYQFNYQWEDHQKKLQSIVFSLEKSAMFNKFRNFRTYKPKLAARQISNKIMKYLNKNPVKNVQIHYDKKTGNITVKGSDLALINDTEEKILTLHNEFTQQYLQANWYHTFTTYDNIQAIKPDHVTFASLSADDLKPMKPLILETVSIQNIRKATDHVLAFVQNIPYSTLNSRVESSGSGFNPPLKLLWENQGDCDSKVTLTAAILRALMPRIKMVLIFIDNHALIGIDVLARADEVTITLDGTTYLLAEPTGPALLPLGTLNQTSELAIIQGQYTAEKFH